MRMETVSEHFLFVASVEAGREGEGGVRLC